MVTNWQKKQKKEEEERDKVGEPKFIASSNLPHHC